LNSPQFSVPTQQLFPFQGFQRYFYSSYKIAQIFYDEFKENIILFPSPGDPVCGFPGENR
jgi:hypothetical protein